MKLGQLDQKKGNAIIQATDEILEGQYLDQFVVDVIQGGAGTSLNMNTNEVIANRAIEILGGEKRRLYDNITEFTCKYVSVYQ